MGFWKNRRRDRCSRHKGTGFGCTLEASVINNEIKCPFKFFTVSNGYSDIRFLVNSCKSFRYNLYVANKGNVIDVAKFLTNKDKLNHYVYISPDGIIKDSLMGLTRFLSLDFNCFSTKSGKVMLFKNDFYTVVNSGLCKSGLLPDEFEYIHPDNERFKDTYKILFYSKEAEVVNLNVFRDKHKGLGCYFIGKGKSLDSLTASSFPHKNYPIICINQSIHKVESLNIPNPLYVMQYDLVLQDLCKPNKENTVWIMNKQCRMYGEDFKNRIVIDNMSLGDKAHALSILGSIEIAKIMGCNNFILLCFDNCVNQDLSYPSCIKYPIQLLGDGKTLPPHIYYNHRNRILEAAGNIPCQFYLGG